MHHILQAYVYHAKSYHIAVHIQSTLVILQLCLHGKTGYKGEGGLILLFTNLRIPYMQANKTEIELIILIFL